MESFRLLFWKQMSKNSCILVFISEKFLLTLCLSLFSNLSVISILNCQKMKKKTIDWFVLATHRALHFFINAAVTRHAVGISIKENNYQVKQIVRMENRESKK